MRWGPRPREACRPGARRTGRGRPVRGCCAAGGAGSRWGRRPPGRAAGLRPWRRRRPSPPLRPRARPCSRLRLRLRKVPVRQLPWRARGTAGPGRARRPDRRQAVRTGRPPGGGRRDRPGLSPADRFLDLRGQLRRLGQPLVTQHRREAVGVALAHGPHLPGVLPAVELHGDDGGLGAQAGDRVAGDAGAVEAGDRDGRRGGRTEGGQPTDAGGQRQQHTHPVDGGGHRVEIHRDAVLGGRLAGNLDAGTAGRARVGHRLGAGEPALLVAEGDAGDDGTARRHPDLHPCPVQWMVLPPDQLGRHRCSPW